MCRTQPSFLDAHHLVLVMIIHVASIFLVANKSQSRGNAFPPSHSLDLRLSNSLVMTGVSFRSLLSSLCPGEQGDGSKIERKKKERYRK